MLWSAEGHRQHLPAAVAFCYINTSTGDPQIEHHCIHFQLTFLAFKHRKWGTQRTEWLPRQLEDNFKFFFFFLSNYRTDKHKQTHLLIWLRAQSAKTCFVFKGHLTPPHSLHTWCTAGYTHALPHVCVFAFMFFMSFMFPLCLCGFFQGTSGTFLLQSTLELETPWCECVSLWCVCVCPVMVW